MAISGIFEDPLTAETSALPCQLLFLPSPLIPSPPPGKLFPVVCSVPLFTHWFKILRPINLFDTICFEIRLHRFLYLIMPYLS